MNLEELFGVDHEQLQDDVEYRTEAFFLAITDNIARAMTAAGIATKSELAKRLGVTPGRVSALLGGYKKNVELKTIVQYAMALGVSPHEICAPRRTREMMGKLHAVPGYEEATVSIEVESNDDSAPHSLSA